MEFRIAYTFTDSFARLTGEEQKTVKTTAFDNPLNPAQTYAPDNPFNPANRYDPDNPVNPANRYSPNCSKSCRLRFAPVAEGHHVSL
jgi:hypothetical protein